MSKTRIKEVRPSISGAFVSLICSVCDHAFEVYHPTIAGVAVLSHNCENCQAMAEVDPDEFLSALDFGFSRVNVRATIQEASEIARTWYDAPIFRDYLRYRGYNLGEPAERELLSFISFGLVKASLAKGFSNE